MRYINACGLLLLHHRHRGAFGYIILPRERYFKSSGRIFTPTGAIFAFLGFILLKKCAILIWMYGRSEPCVKSR